MSREADMRVWIDNPTMESTRAEGPAALASLAEILSGVALELAALNDNFTELARAVGIGSYENNLMDALYAIGESVRKANGGENL